MNFKEIKLLRDFELQSDIKWGKIIGFGLTIKKNTCRA